YLSRIACCTRVCELFFFSSRRRHTRFSRDWSSDVCSSDFIDALDPEQRERLRFPVDHDEWRNWANVHRFPREGVSLDEMTPAQQIGRASCRERVVVPGGVG